MHCVARRFKFCRLSCLDRSFATWRAHDVGHDSERAEPIEYKGDDGAKDRAVGGSGFGHGHHQDNIDPGNNNKVHDGGGLVRVDEYCCIATRFKRHSGLPEYKQNLETK